MTALLLIIYLLPIFAFFVYCGYKHQEIDGSFMTVLAWPIALPILLLVGLIRTLYLLGEWSDEVPGTDFWKYLIANFSKYFK